MRTVTDLRRAFAEDTVWTQVPPGLEHRVIAALETLEGPRRRHETVRARSRHDSVTSPRAAALIAALLTVAIVVTLVIASRALQMVTPTPAHPAPLPFRMDLCHQQCELASKEPFAAMSPIARQCVINGADACQFESVFFATPAIGWTSSGSVSPSGPSSLYRTDDSGQHWHPILSWDGPPAAEVQSSADGRDTLVVVYSEPGSVTNVPHTTFHTTDGGAHWAAYGFPITAQILPAVVDFVDTREGWVLADAGLMHTTDSGAHWTLVGQLTLQGTDGFERMLFSPPLIALVTGRGHVFLSRDAGRTWLESSLPRPKGAPASAEFFNAEIQFFNNTDGVLVDYNCAAIACSQANVNYVYRTTDGGTHWSDPVRLPNDVAATVFIDSNHWIGMTSAFPSTAQLPDTRVRSLIRTADGGQHWDVLIEASTLGYLPGWDSLSPPGFSDPLHGWTTNQGPSNKYGFTTLLVTSDGGATWVIRPLPGAIFGP